MNLEEKTLVFWEVSSAWNCHELATRKKVTVANALGALREIRLTTDPNRPLGLRANQLTESIVLGQDDSALHLPIEEHQGTTV